MREDETQNINHLFFEGVFPHLLFIIQLESIKWFLIEVASLRLKSMAGRENPISESRQLYNILASYNSVIKLFY